MATPARTLPWRAPRGGVVSRGSTAVARVETAEMAAAASFLSAVPAAIRRDLGVRVERVDGALVTMVAGADILGLNRVVGLGVNTPCTERQLDRIVALFEEMGIRRWLAQVVPGAEPVRVPEWLEERNLVPHNRWVRLVRPLTHISATSVDGAVELRRVERADAERFADVVITGFKMPPQVAPLVTATVGRPGWHHTLAWRDGVAVGSGALYTAGDVAWIGFATVLEPARRRGVHGAVVGHRLMQAQRLGCTEICVETAEPTEQYVVPSHRTMLSRGFQERYRRQNWAHSR